MVKAARLFMLLQDFAAVSSKILQQQKLLRTAVGSRQQAAGVKKKRY